MIRHICIKEAIKARTGLMVQPGVIVGALLIFSLKLFLINMPPLFLRKDK